jgi:class 3 adenylate cyclase
MLSHLRSLLLRLAGRQEIRPADGVVVAALLMIPTMMVITSAVYAGAARPDLFRYADPQAYEMVLAINSLIALPGWIGLLLAGLVARRRWAHSRLLPHAAAQLFMINAAFGSYFLGHYTDLWGAMALFAGTAIGLLLFEPRIVRAGIITFFVLVATTTIAERLEVLPYAPGFAQSPVEAGRLSIWWLMWGSFCFLILLSVALFLVAAMQRLRRATSLIRRYVPTQLAEKILAGEHPEMGTPERLKVTLFFSDVVGFTPAADQMEPEDLATLLNDYLAEMSRIAEAHGATINQFVGDGIMIFFGAPEATDEREGALCCVRMALAMQHRMVELGERWFKEGIQTPFRIRVGINTGVASVGDFGSEGRRTYSAIGNQTNLTARIQVACEPGKILVSHTTWALIHDEIPCKERGEIEVKGLHYPVRVYEVAESASPVSAEA